MIIEIYILIQCLILILLFLGWKDNHPLYWTFAFVFSSVLVFSSYNIEYVVMVLQTDGILSTNIVSLAFPILSYINIMLGMFAMLMFFVDVFNPEETTKR